MTAGMAGSVAIKGHFRRLRRLSNTNALRRKHSATRAGMMAGNTGLVTLRGERPNDNAHEQIESGGRPSSWAARVHWFPRTGLRGAFGSTSARKGHFNLSD